MPALICVGAAACGGRVAAPPDASAPSDTAPPVVTLSGPAEVNTRTVTVTGTALDVSKIAEVSINGVPASSSDGYASFTAVVRVDPGANHIVASARDEFGNLDPAAATLDVTCIDDTAPPSIVEVFPPSFAGFEGTKLTVYARVTDASPISSVTVGGVAAALDANGYWVAEDVPAGTNVTIVATDRWGQSTQVSTSAIDSTPFGVALAPLAPEPSGTLIGYDSVRQSLYRYNAAGTPRAALVSGATRGSGPALVDPNSDVVIGIGVVASAIYLGVVRGNELRIMSVNPSSGARSLSHTCMMPSGAFGFVAIPGPRFFATSWDGTRSTFLYECAPTSSAPTVVGQMSRFIDATEVAYDDANQRIVIADSNTAEVDAIALATGTFSLIAAPLQGSFGARALAVVSGTPYFVSYENMLYRVPSNTTTAEFLTQVGSNFPAAMAPCFDGTATVLCVQSTGGSRMFMVSQGAAGWTATPVPFDNLIGSGLPPTAVSAITIPSAHGGHRLLYSDVAGQLNELDMITGTRNLIGGRDIGVLSQPTPAGLVVTGNWGTQAAQMIDTSQPTPVFRALPGLPVAPYRFAVLPANTRLANESLVYVTNSSSSLRLRDLVTGDDTEIAQVADIESLATQDDGTIYLGTYPNLVSRIPAGSSTIEPMGQLLSGEPAFVYFDPATRKVYSGYGPLTEFDPITLSKTEIDLGAFDFPLGSVTDVRPGPIPGTVLATPYGLDGSVIAIDLLRQKSFVLGR